MYMYTVPPVSQNYHAVHLNMAEHLDNSPTYKSVLKPTGTIGQCLHVNPSISKICYEMLIFAS